MHKTVKTAIVCAAAAFAAATASAEALVFNFKATLKTTVAKQGKIKSSALTCLDESEKLVYRKQGSVKIEGLIWGCDCEALATVTGYTELTTDGCLFWDVSAKQLLENGSFAWKLLNRIDSNGKKAEGAWRFESECYDLTGGGFGSVKTQGKGDETTFFINNLSGNVAGWKCAPGLTIRSGTYRPCTFCDEGEEETEETEIAQAWSLCGCDTSDEFTAISGTWTLKYNKKASAKLSDSTSILEAYSFPSYVKSKIGG